MLRLGEGAPEQGGSTQSAIPLKVRNDAWQAQALQLGMPWKESWAALGRSSRQELGQCRAGRPNREMPATMQQPPQRLHGRASCSPGSRTCRRCTGGNTGISSELASQRNVDLAMQASSWARAAQRCTQIMHGCMAAAALCWPHAGPGKMHVAALCSPTWLRPKAQEWARRRGSTHEVPRLGALGSCSRGSSAADSSMGKPGWPCLAAMLGRQKLEQVLHSVTGATG